MAINPSAIGTQTVVSNTEVVIEMLGSRPVLGELISPLKAPGQLCGYYNAIDNVVELYIVSGAGNRYLRIG